MNVPCPDEDAAERTMASPECFCSGASRHAAGSNEDMSTGGAFLVDGKKSSEISSGAHAAADGTASGMAKPFKSATGVSREATTVHGDGDADNPEDCGEIEAGVGEGKGGKHSPSGGGDDVDLGVTALRTLLESFSILDWSLFG